MKAWLTTLGAAIVAALAIFAAAREKDKARQWQETAVDIEEGNVENATLSAEAASAQADLHDQRADDIKAKAEAKVSKRDEATADILRRWGT